jgi:hypothetical protein
MEKKLDIRGTKNQGLLCRAKADVRGYPGTVVFGPNLPFFALGNAAVQLRQTGHCQWCAAFGEIDGQLCGYIGPMRLRH